MLAEFALTPSIFDESVHTDCELWRERLLDLGRNMFPQTAAWPVMISNLYAGGWHHHVLNIVRGIQDQKARVLCEDLLKNLAKTLVPRPITSDEWPDDDSVAWGREAGRSHLSEPIDRVVACNPARQILLKDWKFVRGIEEVQDGGFWSEVSSEWSQAMTIQSQVDALRKLCVHSDFLCLVSPYIAGNELEFATELVRSACKRPDGFAAAEIEVHTAAPDDDTGAEREAKLRNRIHNVAAVLKKVLRTGQKMRLVMWNGLLDRYLLAGIRSQHSDGTWVRSPRWGVSMPHIARRADEHAPKPPTFWSLLGRGHLGAMFDQYCKANVAGFVTSQEISG